MKTIITNPIRPQCIAVSLLCLLASSLSAQSNPTANANYTRLDFDFIQSQPVITGNGVMLKSNHNLYGMGVGLLYGYNITGHSIPLYLEIGPECSFVRRTEEIDYWEEDIMTQHEEVKTQLLTIGTPINLAYHLRLTDVISLTASTGLNAKVNLLAEVRSDAETTDLFEEGANRFQMGWNIGCSVNFKHFSLGLRHQDDFTPFISNKRDKERYSNFTLSLGFKF